MFPFTSCMTTRYHDVQGIGLLPCQPNVTGQPGRLGISHWPRNASHVRYVIPRLPVVHTDALPTGSPDMGV